MAWWCSEPRLGIHGLAYGVILGAALHLAIQAPGLVRYGFRWTPRLTLRDTAVRQVLRLMGPRILTLGLLNLIFIANDNLASHLGTGAVSALAYGWLILQLPETVIGTAAGTALLPTLSELAARGRRVELRRLLRRAVLILLGLTIPATLAGEVLLRPAIKLVFEGRAFTPENSELVILAARMFLLGLAGHCLVEVAARSFYAHLDARTPLLMAVMTLSLYVVLAMVLSPVMGLAGLALANSLAFSTEAISDAGNLALETNPMNRQLVWIILTAALLAACAAPGATATPAPATPTTAAAASVTEQPAATATVVTATEVPPTAPPTNTAAPAPTATAASTRPAGGSPGDYVFEKVADGFALPLLVTHAGDGSGRMFVVQQRGLIRIMKDGQVLPEPFLDLSALVTPGGNEQGLLGLAFAPDYAQSGIFYVHYTDLNGDTRVARYRAPAPDADQADPDSAEVLLSVDQPYANHNGGYLAFGPDGFLYVGLGDGGSQGDPHGNGQNKNALLGKLLRLDVSGGGESYSVPPSNPFVGQADARGEVWAYGFRNPWRFTFDRATGDLFIGDVGQNAYEEIDYQPAASPGGENYGWNLMEGPQPYRGNPPAGAVLVPPVAEYSHDVGGCSVTGGYVYRGPGLPELDGTYFYGDYCSGLIWTLIKAGDRWQSAQFAVDRLYDQLIWRG